MLGTSRPEVDDGGCSYLSASSRIDEVPALLRWRPFCELLGLEADDVTAKKEQWTGRFLETPCSSSPVDWEGLIEGSLLVSSLCRTASGRRDIFASRPDCSRAIYEASQAAGDLAYRSKSLRAASDGYRYASRKAQADFGTADERFGAALRDLARDAERLEAGGCLLAPFGWRADGKGRGHVGVMVMARGGGDSKLAASKDSESFTCVAVNRGHDADGACFHPAIVDARAGSTKRRTAAILQSVPRHKLSHAATWFVLLRSLVLPPATGGRDDGDDDEGARKRGFQAAREWYETCLPFLADDVKQILRSDDDFDASAGKVQLSHATVCGLLEAVKYASRCVVDAADARRCCAAVKLCGLEALSDQIEDASNVRLGERDVRVARALARRVAAAAVDAEDSMLARSVKAATVRLERILKRRAARAIRTRADDFEAVAHATSFAGTPLALAAAEAKQRRANEAGLPRVEPLALPVDLARVRFPLRSGDNDDDLTAGVTAMRRADRACVVLENMCVPRGAARRFALVSSLFLRCLPCPRPPDQERCFWRSNVRRETQRDALALLRRLALHLAASSAELAQTRELDGERALALAAVAAAADAVVRAVAIDEPSALSLFYSGSRQHLAPRAERPFGFDLRFFAADTARALLSDPALVSARSALLDYYRATRKMVPGRNVIFRWESRCGGPSRSNLPPWVALSLGDARLLDRLCVSLAYDVAPHGADLADYLAGTKPGLLDDLPELAHLRDIVTILKLATAPTATGGSGMTSDDGVPGSMRARPEWRVAEPDGGDVRARAQIRHKKFPSRLADAVGSKIIVSAFSQDVDFSSGPSAAENSPEVDDEAREDDVDDHLLLRPKAGPAERFLAVLRAALTSDAKPRAPPSGADPSHLAGDLVTCEDDVLHLKSLPGDLGAFSVVDQEARLAGEPPPTWSLAPRDVERLLCYLTAPYLRLPLVLRYFCESGKLRALRDSRLRDTLDSVLFEPGAWLPADALDGDMSAVVIPAADRNYLRTPAGALANELSLAPSPTLDAIDRLLDLALDLDVGRFSASSSPVVLFAVRIAARVQAFAYTVATASAVSTKQSAPSDAVRGLADAPQDSKVICAYAAKRLAASLGGRAATALRRWLSRAKSIEERAMIHAHLGYLYARILVNENEEDDAAKEQRAAAMLAAQCYLSANPSVDVEVSDVELCGLWQVRRAWLLEFLRSKSASVNRVLESAVDAATSDDDNGSYKKATTIREWRESSDYPGRFAPQDDDDDRSRRAEDDVKDDDEDYEHWLRARLASALRSEIVDVQLGEFVLRRSRLEQLPAEVRGHADLLALGVEADAKAAELAQHQFRSSYRLLSARVDVNVWHPPVQDRPPPFEASKLRYLSKLKRPGEAWIEDALVRLELDGATLYLPKEDCSKQSICVLRGFQEIAEEQTKKKKAHTEATTRRVWREWHVAKETGVVEVYDVVDHARRWLRVLVKTTEQKYSLGRPAASRRKAITFDVSRTARRCSPSSTATRQTYVPRRFLSGALPDALLDNYDFWRNDDDLGGLVGFQRKATPQHFVVVVDGSGRRVRRVALAPHQKGNAVSAGAGDDPAVGGDSIASSGAKKTTPKRGFLSGLLMRKGWAAEKLEAAKSFVTGESTASDIAKSVALPEHVASRMGIDSEEAALDLICLRHETTKSLASRLVWLVNLADALVWVRSGVVVLVDFPRLGLTFHGPELKCREYGGFRLARNDEMALELGDHDEEFSEVLDALPSALVLCDEADASNIKVILPASSSSGATAFAYDVDRVSAALVPPNVAAATHLVHLLYVSRKWSACAALAFACVSDDPRSATVTTVLEALAEATHPKEPDAVACRLRLILACSGTGCEGGFTPETLPFDIDQDVAVYFAKIEEVSGELRLPLSEERHILRVLRLPLFSPDAIDAPVRREMHNRMVAVGGASDRSDRELSTPPTFDLARIAKLDDTNARHFTALQADRFDAGKNLAYARPVGFEILLGDDDQLKNDVEPRSLSLNGGHAIRWLRETLANPAGLTRYCIAIYELLTGTLPIRVGDRDGPFGWGAALVHMLERTHPQTNTSSEDVLIASVLYILAKKGGLTHKMLRGGDLLRYKPAPKPKTLAEKMLASEPKRLYSLLSSAAKGLRAARYRGEISVPSMELQLATPPLVRPDVVPLDEANLVFLAARNLDKKSSPRATGSPTQQRKSSTLFALDDASKAFSAVTTSAVLQSDRQQPSALNGGNDDTLILLSSVRDNAGVTNLLDEMLMRPLGGLAERYAPKESVSSGASGSGRISAEPPFEVKWGAVGGEPTATSHEKRLRKAAMEYAAVVAKTVTPRLFGDDGKGRFDAAKTASALVELKSELDKRDAADAKAAKLARVALANIGAIGDDLDSLNLNLARFSGREPRLGLRWYLDASSRDEASNKSNIEDPDARALACAVALLEGRSAHARRCASRCEALARRAEGAASFEAAASSPSVVAELRLEAEALAEALWETRSHFKAAREGKVYAYDARLLLVEQVFGIFLRPPQVEVALNLTDLVVSKKQSRITQMIMGAGKTTIVLPTLVYLLGHGTRLVCAVVPTSLVVFTRDALRRRLSRPSLGYRPVWRLIFGRRSIMSASLVRKFESCASRGGVILADPTSVKALFLKSIEVLHGLDESLRSAHDAEAESEAIMKRTARKSTFSALFASKKSVERERRAAAALGVSHAKPIEPAASQFEEESLRLESEVAKRAMAVLRTGVAILDEVDVVLHPLRSELNWPLGNKAPLDFTVEASGLRWRIPHLLIDAVTSTLEQSSGRRRTQDHRELPGRRDLKNLLRVPSPLDDVDDIDEDADDEEYEHDGEFGAAHEYSGNDDGDDDEGVAARRELRLAREAIDDVVRQGFADGALARSPHLILLSPQYYDTQLRPALTTWVVRLLRSATRWAAEYAGAGIAGDLGGLDDDTLRAYLGARSDAGARVGQVCSDDQAKLLNIYQAWLSRVLPFVLSRVDRVHYGLLSADDVRRAVKRFREREVNLTSRIAAVPLARRLLAVPFISKDVPSEASEFSHPDVLIGLSILAVTHEGLRHEDVRRLVKDLKRSFDNEAGDEPIPEKRPSYRRFERYVVDAGGIMRGSTASKEAAIDEEEEEMWPLPLIDSSDAGLMLQVCKVLKRSRLAARDYLWRLAFPATLSLRPSKLHASGQELGGDAIFGARLGFSGTPNDLVPAELCVDFDAGDDGKIASVLADKSVVAIEVVEPGWTPRSLLDRVASEPYDALIDCGALITHMTNLEVGAYVAERLDPGDTSFEGVLCFDQEDNQFLIKADGSAAPAEVSPDRRVTFYDHAHCTGVDIKQKVDATACVTLSKDTTYRDFAQAAFRLRGLGRGQAIVVLLIPELVPLILEATRETWELKAAPQDVAVRDVLSWLVTNEIRKERPNFYLLAEQNVANVVRKVAHRRLLENVEDVGSTKADREKVQSLRTCLDVFRMRVDYTVENAVPVQQPTSERVAKLVEEYADLMTSAPDFSTAQRSLQLVSQAEESSKKSSKRRADGAVAREESTFAGQQEQEAEEEAQEEEEQEHQQQVIQHQMAVVEEEDRKYDEPEVQRYSRQDETPMPWSLDVLLSAPQLMPPDAASKHPFYAIEEFQVYKQSYQLAGSGGVGAADKPPRVTFPRELRLSSNYHRPQWSTSAPRRIKNVSIVLEYTPASSSSDAKVDDDLADANYDSVLRSRQTPEELRAEADAAKAASERLSRAYASYAAATAIADESRIRSTQELARAPGQLGATNVGHAYFGPNDGISSSQLAEVDEARGRQMLRAANLRGSAGSEYDALPAQMGCPAEALASSYTRRALRPRALATTYVVLSLDEAEHLRGTLHMRARRGDCGDDHRLDGVALRLVGTWDPARTRQQEEHQRCSVDVGDGIGVVLDGTPGRRKPPIEHDAKVMACLQFFDVADEVSPRHAALLLRALQRTPVPERLRFRDDVSRCRRRPRVAAFSTVGWIGTLIVSAGRRVTAAATSSSRIETSSNPPSGQQQPASTNSADQDDDDVVAAAAEMRDAAMAAINRRRAVEAGRASATKPAMRFAHTALVLNDETAVVEWRAALLAIRRALRRRRAPVTALLRRTIRASLAAADQAKAKGVSIPSAEALFPVGVVACALRWLDIDFDKSRASPPDACLVVARALDVNCDGWIALDELRTGLYDARAFEIKRDGEDLDTGGDDDDDVAYAPFLPLPRVRPVVTEVVAPDVDDAALAGVLAGAATGRSKRGIPGNKDSVDSAKGSAESDSHAEVVTAASAATRRAAKATRELHAAAIGGNPTGDGDEPYPVDVVVDSGVIKAARALTLEDTRGIVVRLKTPGRLEPIWSSLGTASGSQVSVWRPEASKMTSRSGHKLCVGYYVARGVDDPSGGEDAAAASGGQSSDGANYSSSGSASKQDSDDPRVLCIEIVDTYTFRRNRSRLLAAVAERLCPPPLRFRQVWHLPQGDRSVYGWAPVPRSDQFVALGHVATRHQEPPDPRCVRTVPAAWCVKADTFGVFGSQPVWTNSSLGGRKGSLWRQYDTSLLFVCRGHTFQSETPVYRLVESQIIVSDHPESLREANDRDEVLPKPPSRKKSPAPPSHVVDLDPMTKIRTPQSQTPADFLQADPFALIPQPAQASPRPSQSQPHLAAIPTTRQAAETTSRGGPVLADLRGPSAQSAPSLAGQRGSKAPPQRAPIPSRVAPSDPLDIFGSTQTASPPQDHDILSLVVDNDPFAVLSGPPQSQPIQQQQPWNTPMPAPPLNTGGTPDLFDLSAPATMPSSDDPFAGLSSNGSSAAAPFDSFGNRPPDAPSHPPPSQNSDWQL